MLFTGFPQFWFFFAIFSSGLFIGLLIFTVKHVRKLTSYAAECAAWMESNNLDALSDSKIAELERSLTELWDSHQSLLASHKRLRSKYGMQDLRERRKNGEDEASDDMFAVDSEKSAYKDKLRQQMRAKGLLR